MAQADEMSSSAAESVQCPVCLKDFTPTTINKHLDVCLLGGAADTTPSTMADNSGPPPKKPRVSGGSAPASPAVNKPGAGSFSLFHSNKLKPPQPGERTGLFPSKHSPVNNKGLKRGAVEEADTEPAAGTETVRGQTSGSVKAPPAPSLLTMNKPLAETLRPNTLDQYFGQSQVVGQQTLIRSLLDSQEIPSLILWGPPGCGKVGWSLHEAPSTVYPSF